MSFFSNLFRAKKTESVILIDVTAGSVAGAYAHRVEGQLPVLLYAKRLSIVNHAGEPHERAMLRALAVLGEALITEGAPALARYTGSGTTDCVLVSIDAPWQETAVRTEYFESESQFVFTKALVEKAMQKAGCASVGKVICDESVVGTLLNGYETHEPYGKSAHRATVVILTSMIEESVAKGIAKVLHELYHTKRVEIIAGSSLRYQALRAAFPHEHNALILDATGHLVSIELVRNDLLVAISETPDGSTGGPAWAHEVTRGLAELAKRYPLPRNIFLLARDSEIEKAQKMLASSGLGSLWLSDNPPKIVSVSASHFTNFVKLVDVAIIDLPLILMTLYAHSRS